MMQRRTFFRLIRIQRVLVKYGLDEFISATHLLRPLRFFFYLAPRRRDRSAPQGERIRLALEELGPIFVKFGQAISTRRDLLPPDIANELAKLQDAVPPFPTEQAIAILESAYGKPIDTVFTRFDREPLAAASIAQVHAAELPDGTEVVVKVLRPGVREKIEQDLEVMRTIAALASRYWEHGERLKPLEVVAEYEQTIIDELDLMREAGNAAQLKRNFEGSEMLYVPEIYWDFCRPEVLVQERIHGIPISDMEALRAAGTNIEKLAENGVEIFFTQVFRHNFFHADMHPGNIFVNVTDPENPKYAAVDFGIVGTLNPEDKQYLAENFLAFFERDYYRIAKLHLDSGWVPDDARIDQLETAVRTVCEPIFNKPLSEISFAQVLMRLFRVAQRFNVEIQPQLILLHKTLFNIEGLGRELYPELDIFKTARPVLKQWMDEQVGARAMIDDLRENLPQLRQALRELPGVIRELSERATAGDLTLDLRSAEIERIRRELEGQRQQRYWLIVAMTSLLAGTLVLTLQGNLYIGGGLLVAGALGVFAGRPNA
ncbi:MAG: ubiquinone biosynthesis regulatory protein kinase UbiB [Gammaproteobacteria bacterium]|nr:ubiquinone biosynthesis regulatory protein kinase UbiB [Gammaproteobacteria bacterium]MDH3863420.1 ubiquinone biosynthesis regulatory protein kinase UbiB [Gammaproteobacteria bacterium]MDH3906086.1 ubiquinone biosynthesis regulatory protein kinase UbiB [Gammaproteobacteria bacterium]MDH4004395.1 ubiquinone biosynthesis regulatory protein kinase UbiB [Gammaproteobacteria bacterium]